MAVLASFPGIFWHSAISKSVQRPVEVSDPAPLWTPPPNHTQHPGHGHHYNREPFTLLTPWERKKHEKKKTKSWTGEYMGNCTNHFLQQSKHTLFLPFRAPRVVGRFQPRSLTASQQKQNTPVANSHLISDRRWCATFTLLLYTLWQSLQYPYWVHTIEQYSNSHSLRLRPTWNYPFFSGNGAAANHPPGQGYKRLVTEIQVTSQWAPFLWLFSTIWACHALLLLNHYQPICVTTLLLGGYYISI